MNTKHTPWALNEDGDIINSQGNLVPIIGVSLPSRNHPDRKQAEENKLLFAAAPELLEALQMIIAACDRCEQDDDKSLIDEFNQEMEDKARAVIAKATGRK